MAAYDPMITCPYNTSHNILKSRMQYHLTKCRRQFPDVDTEICPFDATHHIPKPELAFHLSVCSNRKVLDNAKYVTADSVEKVALPTYVAPSLPPASENWDDDLVTSSYQPSEKAAEAPVLRTLIGATKSERRAFRLQERKRVQELQEKGYSEPSPIPSISSAPLRLPNNFVPVVSNPDLGMGRGATPKSKPSTSSANILSQPSTSSSWGAGGSTTVASTSSSSSSEMLGACSNAEPRASTSNACGVTSEASTDISAPKNKNVAEDIKDKPASDDPLSTFSALSLSRGRGGGSRKKN